MKGIQISGRYGQIGGGWVLSGTVAFHTGFQIDCKVAKKNQKEMNDGGGAGGSIEMEVDKGRGRDRQLEEKTNGRHNELKRHTFKRKTAWQ